MDNQYGSVGSDNGLVPNSWQTIIWTNDGYITDAYMCHSASISTNLWIIETFLILREINGIFFCFGSDQSIMVFIMPNEFLPNMQAATIWTNDSIVCLTNSYHQSEEYLWYWSDIGGSNIVLTGFCSCCSWRSKYFVTVMLWVFLLKWIKHLFQVESDSLQIFCFICDYLQRLFHVILFLNIIFRSVL